MWSVTHTQWGTFLVNTDSWVDRVIYEGKFFDKHMEKVLRTHCPEQFCLDVGAANGFYSVCMAMFGAKAVLAFEPQPRSAQQVQAQFLLNELPMNRAHCVMAPAYSRGILMRLADWQPTPLATHDDGSVDYDKSGEASSFAFVPARQEDQGTPRLYIHSVVLDEMSFVHRVGFMKVDAQGCDLEVLRGARKILTEQRPTVVFEFEPDLVAPHGYDFSECQEFMAEMNYSIDVIKRDDGYAERDYLCLPR